MLYLSPKYTAAIARPQDLNLIQHTISWLMSVIRHYTKSILCSSQLHCKSIPINHSAVLPMQYPAAILNPNSTALNPICQDKQPQGFISDMPFSVWVCSDLLPRQYTQLCNTTHQIMYVGSKLPGVQNAHLGYTL